MSTKSGSAPTGLYLVLPENWMEPEFLKQFRDLFRAINASAYEKNNHIIEFRPTVPFYDAAQTEIITALSELTRSQGVIFIVADDFKLAKKCNADGVLLSNIDDVAAAREALGEEAIVGLRCGTSRRMAEQALQAGVDYVSFRDATGRYVDPGLVQWWHYKTDDPCLVEGSYTNDDCAFYVHAGADLIEASQYVWTHPEGVMKGVVNMNHAIDLAADDMKKEVRQ